LRPPWGATHRSSDPASPRAKTGGPPTRSRQAKARVPAEARGRAPAETARAQPADWGQEAARAPAEPKEPLGRSGSIRPVAPDRSPALHPPPLSWLRAPKLLMFREAFPGAMALSPCRTQRRSIPGSAPGKIRVGPRDAQTQMGAKSALHRSGAGRTRTPDFWFWRPRFRGRFRL
jgi:hypothetical protein